MAVGAVEAGLWAFAEPAMNAFLMDAVPESRGEAQGIVGTALSAAMAIGSLLAGTLFAIGLAVPFVAGAVACVALVLAALPSLRAAGQRAGGRVTTVA
jgi:MFS family permease